MLEYKTSLSVYAAKILSTQGERSTADAYEITLEGLGAILVSYRGYMERHSVEVGGYYVEYPDGFHGYLPGDTFEAVYGHVEDAGTTVANTAPVAEPEPAQEAPAQPQEHE